MDNRRPINCQVRTCSVLATLEPGSDWLESQGCVLFYDCEHWHPIMHPNIRGRKMERFTHISLLGLGLLVYVCLFTIDCSSHVCPHQHFCDI